MSGDYSLILCNVLCTLPPGILTYYQMANKCDIIKACFHLLDFRYWVELSKIDFKNSQQIIEMLAMESFESTKIY